MKQLLLPLPGEALRMANLEKRERSVMVLSAPIGMIEVLARQMVSQESAQRTSPLIIIVEASHRPSADEALARLLKAVPIIDPFKHLFSPQDFERSFLAGRHRKAQRSMSKKFLPAKARK